VFEPRLGADADWTQSVPVVLEIAQPDGRVLVVFVNIDKLVADIPPHVDVVVFGMDFDFVGSILVGNLVVHPLAAGGDGRDRGIVGIVERFWEKRIGLLATRGRRDVVFFFPFDLFLNQIEQVFGDILVVIVVEVLICQFTVSVAIDAAEKFLLSIVFIDGCEGRRFTRFRGNALLFTILVAGVGSGGGSPPWIVNEFVNVDRVGVGILVAIGLFGCRREVFSVGG
jgi:hypothetical protein